MPVTFEYATVDVDQEIAGNEPKTIMIEAVQHPIPEALPLVVLPKEEDKTAGASKILQAPLAFSYNVLGTDQKPAETLLPLGTGDYEVFHSAGGEFLNQM